jgi:hypothetical protein
MANPILSDELWAVLEPLLITTPLERSSLGGSRTDTNYLLPGSAIRSRALHNDVSASLVFLTSVSIFL